MSFRNSATVPVQALPVRLILLLLLSLWTADSVLAQNQASVRVGENRLDMLAPQLFAYTDGNQFEIVSNSVSGSASGPVTPVAVQLGFGNSSDSGCQPAHFDDFPAGHIALIQRGSCPFSEKVSNAEAAGASRVLLFNQGNIPDNTGMLYAELGDAWSGTIPVLSSSYAFGEYWAGLDGLEMHIETKLFRGSRAEALLRYCQANDDHCAMSVRYVNDGWERHLNADRLHVTASTYKTLSLIAYAEAVDAGILNPAQVISKEEWSRFSVRFDGNAMAHLWTRLGEPDQLTVEEMMYGMMRESDNAAPDWLLNQLGSGALASVVDDYINGYHDVPISINAFFLLLFGHSNEPNPATRLLAQYDSLQNPGLRQELHDLFSGPMQNGAHMQAQRDFLCVALPWDSVPLPCTFGGQTTRAERSALLGSHFSRTTSRTMLKLMTGLLERNLLPQSVQDIVEPHLEWPLDNLEISANFSRYGSKGGSFSEQNICNATAYAESAAGDQVVVSIYIHNSLHACGRGLFTDSFVQAFALDADFRQLVRDDITFERVFSDRFQKP